MNFLERIVMIHFFLFVSFDEYILNMKYEYILGSYHNELLLINLNLPY